MPLSAPVEREHLHDRHYEFRGFRRKDGLWDIEGRMTDTKTYDFPNLHRGTIRAGAPVHDMLIRLTLDDNFIIRGIEAVTDASPFAICPAITDSFSVIKGLKLGIGWRRQLSERLGGVKGCTHHAEMLAAMATVAYQTMWKYVSADMTQSEPGAARRPGVIDSCHAFASDGEIVRTRWPQFYAGSNSQVASEEPA
jgi:Protein of unknown function (DUF2889)